MRSSFDFEQRDVGSPLGMACYHPDLDLRDDVPIIKAPDKKFKLPKKPQEPVLIITDFEILPGWPDWMK